MRLAALLMGSILAFPVSAQTTNDDTVATETYWDQVGAGFFSDATMETLRPEYEIRAHWTGLSADDQAAVRARCANGEDATALSRQEGDEDENADATVSDLADQTLTQEITTTGSVQGKEVQKASPSDQPEPYTGLAGGVQDGDTRMVAICALIKTL